MANSQHIPGLIRGHEGTITMVPHGEFEGSTPNIILKPEVVRLPGGEQGTFPGYKFGREQVLIPVDQYDMMQAHVGNFLGCMRTREKPHLDVETAGHAQVLISLAVQSYQEGKVKYWDEKNWRAVDAPLSA
jgi:hypothetical protein